jgi:predicted ATPase
MKTSIKRIVIKNRAPFESLDLTFDENMIAVLTAVNGKGKTTILSHIVDAWYEIIRPHFQNEFKGKENQYYRVSSSLFNIKRVKPSFVYIRFKNSEGNIDYIDILNECSQEEYESAITLKERIPFELFNHQLKNNGNIKLAYGLNTRMSPTLHKDLDKKRVEQIFKENVMTYFPAYRYETPGYLNNPYGIHLDFTKESSFVGYLPNPIEVITGLSQLANWIMDIVLDMNLYKQINTINGKFVDSTPERQVLLSSLNKIISRTLQSKMQKGNCRFGIGKRYSGGARISIMSEATHLTGSEQIYPTIFNLSSGEAAIFCLFGEILRQADKNKTDLTLQQITGIVLIDEVDKHLHITLQKDVLPLLFNLFPNVQFIVSSHSPFLNIGLAEKSKTRTKIIDLDNMGISTDPTTNQLYIEVYNMMISENDRFVEKYDILQKTINQDTRPLIITEGKSDVIHLKKAKEVLNIVDCDVVFYEINEDWGCSKLKLLLEQLSKVEQRRKIIGIFDRDIDGVVRDIEKNEQLYKSYSNKVYAFCIPIPLGREHYTNISIEFYYTDDVLRKEKDGRRLFFDNEVIHLFNKTDNKPVYQKLETPNSNKELSKKVFDEDKICEVTDWMHSKVNFANLVANNEEFAKDIDFSNFNLIFQKIKQIINSTN